MSFSADHNIVLIGMPGVGKSTYGVVLAKILNRGFLDTDLVIQQSTGRTLQDIIDEEGPQGFIQIENDVLKAIDCSNTIISTGGSAVYSEEGMHHLGTIGTIVYLKDSVDELSSHLGNFDGRGVTSLQGGEPNLEELYAERGPLYERYADIVVDTEGLTINQALDAILLALKVSEDSNVSDTSKANEASNTGDASQTNETFCSTDKEPF